MKCPICNSENEPDATTCAECGFGLPLSQPAWPDPPTVPRIPITESALWPEPPQIEVPTTPPQASWADDESPVAQFKEQAFTPIELPAAPTLDQDDQLAETHIERGKEALREDLLDQARWEFKQARDLADDQQIVNRAREHLRRLRRPVAPGTDQAPSQQPVQLPNPAPPTVGPEAMRRGVGLGVLNAILTGLGAGLCLGLLFSPFFGFLAGRSAARRSRGSEGSGALINAGVVGAVVGMGGWLGEMVGHPIWMALSADAAPVLTTTLFSSCFLGIVYIFLSVFFGIIGGLTGRKR
jgi:hypothetical protein